MMPYASVTASRTLAARSLRIPSGGVGSLLLPPLPPPPPPPPPPPLSAVFLASPASPAAAAALSSAEETTLTSKGISTSSPASLVSGTPGSSSITSAVLATSPGTDLGTAIGEPALLSPFPILFITRASLAKSNSPRICDESSSTAETRSKLISRCDRKAAASRICAKSSRKQPRTPRRWTLTATRRSSEARTFFTFFLFFFFPSSSSSPASSSANR